MLFSSISIATDKMQRFMTCFILLIVPFGTIIHGRVIDEMVESGHQVGDAVDCGFREFENFLGVGYNQPCRSNVGTEQQSGHRNQINWNLGIAQQNNDQTTHKVQNFGFWNSRTSSATEQNGGSQSSQDFAKQDISVGTFPHNDPEKKEEVVTPNVHKEIESSSQGSKAAPKLGPDNGRRIISARANCPPGFAADARGRCREIM